MDISVVIPCCNEVTTIKNVLDSASIELSVNDFLFELIVVDNGSTDGSDMLAKSCNACVVYSDAKTISGVRNKGVVSSIGRIIVFLDADIIVQRQWGAALRAVYCCLLKEDSFIAGSHPCVPNNIGPVLFSWYKGISEDFRNTHLGTGHLVVSKRTFDIIGGFDETLITGEDFDFCCRAKKNGIDIVTIPQMIVFHLGYPGSLIEFFKREVWHGLGDYSTLTRLISSKVAMVGIILLCLNIVSGFTIFFNLKICIFCLILLVIISSGVNLYKFGYGCLDIFVKRCFVSYIYLLSRGISAPVFIFMKIKNIYISSF